MTRYPVLNIWADAVSLPEVLDSVVRFVEEGFGLHTIFASNPEKNFSVPKDPLLYERFRTADLLLPDGIGVVLALRVLHGVRVSRLTGIEVMQEICGLAEARGFRVFIYGAAEEVNRAAVETLRQRFPNLNIVGRAHGYLPESEMETLAARIDESRAQILFLALGSPKQERWIARFGPQLPSLRVCQGIGGTLDILAGKTKRAPASFRRLGLEWLYRLATEPGRIQRQRVYPVFACQILAQRLVSMFRTRATGSGNG
jgi:N-acetylglucosaminyldiphosphoundecaprenol N-acetyl-beta-D-mannosaminyltransferase